MFPIFVLAPNGMLFVLFFEPLVVLRVLEHSWVEQGRNDMADHFMV